MKKYILPALLITGITAILPALADETQPLSAVAEVFTAATSTCDYQPQGDQEIKDILAKTPDVLVLTCHDAYITEPKLSAEEEQAYKGYCVKRKVEYAGAHDIYTFNIPMVMVNGRYDLNAAYPPQIHTGIAMARSLSQIRPVILFLDDNKTLHFDFSPEIALAAQALGGTYKARLFAYRPETEFRSTDLMSIVNPVTAVRDLGYWDKTPQSYAIPLKGLEPRGLAVILQQEPYGDIIAAGRTEPPAR